jgi:hypothetical protein
MLDELASCYTTKYVGLYEINVKPHLDVYTLKLSTSFVAHPTFHISKLKLFFRDEMKLDLKQKCDQKLMSLNIRSLMQ